MESEEGTGKEGKQKKKKKKKKKDVACMRFIANI